MRALADALELDDEERRRLVAAVPGRVGPVPVTAVPESAPGPVVGALAPPVRLVGREDDVSEVARLLTDGATRVLTLTGPGGVGKTSLALTAARAAAASFPGGMTVVDLSGTTDALAVLPAIGTALGVPEAGFRGRAAGLVPFLSGRRVLLVLDNLEQLLEAAPELAALVAQCPDLVVLGTSRAPLRIRAERELRVLPLEQDTAELLFRERALSSGGRLPDTAPEDAAVAELCRRLDGLPLAIELAASATTLLRPAALLERLDGLAANAARDLPERQRSMAATLDWSLELLEPAERELLARLSVFPAGFSLAGAETVGGEDTLTGLRVLLEHSLVSRDADVQGTERFRLLVPIRQYAATRLDDDERAALTRRVCDHVLQLARDLEPDLRGAALDAGLDLVEADLSTVRLVFAELVGTRRFDDAAELVWRLWLALALRGHAHEGSGWAAQLSGRPMGDVSRAYWLSASAGLAYVKGDIDGVRRHGDAALELAQRIERPDVTADAAVLAGSGALFAGDLATASERLAVAADLEATGKVPWSAAHRRIAEGQVALLAGRVDEADALLDDAERLARELGNAFSLATALNVRATLTELLDDHPRSAMLLAEAAELSVGSRISWTFAYILPALAGVAVRLGDAEAGARLFGASASYSAEHSVATGFQASSALADRDLAAAREQLGEERFRAAWDAGRDTTGAEVVELATELNRRARR